MIIPRVFLITPKEKQDFAATLLPPIFPLNRAFDAIWWQGGSKIKKIKYYGILICHRVGDIPILT
jgi:hypothetical protein